ncbi:YchJ family protein [Thermodesulfobacteriota bacterium]
MEICPCGSERSYDDCCRPLIEGRQNAETAEALMRSRYSAFVKTEIDYLYSTIPPEQQKNFNYQEATNWSENSQWEGLEILETSEGGPDDEVGTVEFIARFRKKDKKIEHHELARFGKIDGRWYFIEGNTPKSKPAVRQSPKIGRNAPCPCGSGKKYKKCCGS